MNHTAVSLILLTEYRVAEQGLSSAQTSSNIFRGQAAITTRPVATAALEPAHQVGALVVGWPPNVNEAHQECTGGDLDYNPAQTEPPYRFVGRQN